MEHHPFFDSPAAEAKASAAPPFEEPLPYVCPECRHPWRLNLTRCIGTDGDHRPVTPIRNRLWPHWSVA